MIPGTPKAWPVPVNALRVEGRAEHGADPCTGHSQRCASCSPAVLSWLHRCLLPFPPAGQGKAVPLLLPPAPTWPPPPPPALSPPVPLCVTSDKPNPEWCEQEVTCHPTAGFSSPCKVTIAPCSSVLPAPLLYHILHGRFAVTSSFLFSMPPAGTKATFCPSLCPVLSPGGLGWEGVSKCLLPPSLHPRGPHNQSATWGGLQLWLKGHL